MIAAARSLLRPERPDDLPFLERLYASTRLDELALTDWDDAARARFCAQQFAAQCAWYLEHYPALERAVVEVESVPIGRLYLEERTDEIRIVDVALLPAGRGHGIGTELLHGTLARSRATGKPVTIHVERFNRALSLYRRLGFRVQEDRGVYLFLEWRPELEAGPEAACSSD